MKRVGNPFCTYKLAWKHLGIQGWLLLRVVLSIMVLSIISRNFLSMKLLMPLLEDLVSGLVKQMCMAIGFDFAGRKVYLCFLKFGIHERLAIWFGLQHIICWSLSHLITHLHNLKTLHWRNRGTLATLPWMNGEFGPSIPQANGRQCLNSSNLESWNTWIDSSHIIHSEDMYHSILWKPSQQPFPVVSFYLSK